MTVQPLKQTRILVIEDEATQRRALVRHLRRAGADCVEAETAEAALEVVARQPVSAVLLDLGVPGGGLELTAKLRTHAARPGLPVVILTGNDDPGVHAAAVAGGASDFLVKPCSSRVLLAHLEACLVRAARLQRSASRATRLQAYVPAALRRQQREEPCELRTTVLFSDLRSFTSTSERRSPAEVFDAVNAVLQAQVGFVRANSGYVDKFSGDGLLAVFDGDSGPANACAAGVAIVRWAQATTADLGPWTTPPIGVGIHSGLVMRGDLGTRDRKEHTVIGHTVNLAARLCGAARALEVVVSEETLTQDWQVLEWRSIPLKGVTGATQVAVIASPRGSGAR